MNDSTKLERRYRRLLALYPRAFRRERGPEMLSVLLNGAEVGQRRPGLAESVNLVSNAMWMRLRQFKLAMAWEYKHRRVMIPVRALIGIWLVVLTLLLCSQYGQWWALVLLAPAALHFFIAYYLGRDAIAEERQGDRAPGQAPRVASQ
jgi:hypothetical protein